LWVLSSAKGSDLAQSPSTKVAARKLVSQLLRYEQQFIPTLARRQPPLSDIECERYTRRGVDFEHLIQEENLGLHRGKDSI
jgi:DNA-directed RNA polymerase sigma subunit (sigma70/sigma32)